MNCCAKLVDALRRGGDDSADGSAEGLVNGCRFGNRRYGRFGNLRYGFVEVRNILLFRFAHSRGKNFGGRRDEEREFFCGCGFLRACSGTEFVKNFTIFFSGRVELQMAGGTLQMPRRLNGE